MRNILYLVSRRNKEVVFDYYIKNVNSGNKIYYGNVKKSGKWVWV
jgi:hypothetical protein